MNSYATTLLLSQINQIGGSQSCAKPNSYTRFWIWGRRKRLDCVQSLISSANTFILSPQPFCSCLTRNYMKYTKIDFQIHPKTLQIVSDTVFTKCPGSQSLVLFAPIELSIWRAPTPSVVLLSFLRMSSGILAPQTTDLPMADLVHVQLNLPLFGKKNTINLG